MLREELRFDTIEMWLGKISSQLDEIMDAQHHMYDELNRMNRNCECIVQTTVSEIRKSRQNLQQIAENTQITAYNTERIQREIEFQNFMLYY